MIRFGGHLEHHCTHDGPHWLILGVRCEEHLGNEALRGSLQDFGVKLLAIVEREPLSLQGLEFLYVGSLVFADGSLGKRRVCDVTLEELVDFGEERWCLIRREG